MIKIYKNRIFALSSLYPLNPNKFSFQWNSSFSPLPPVKAIPALKMCIFIWSEFSLNVLGEGAMCTFWQNVRKLQKHVYFGEVHSTTLEKEKNIILYDLHHAKQFNLNDRSSLSYTYFGSNHSKFVVGYYRDCSST